MRKTRPLFLITDDIRKDWILPNYAAQPYITALKQLDKITDIYYCDSGKKIVLGFLANAGTWRGEKAREIKQELKNILNEKN